MKKLEGEGRIESVIDILRCAEFELRNALTGDQVRREMSLAAASGFIKGAEECMERTRKYFRITNQQPEAE